MNTYELIRNDYIEEAHLHIKRGMELLEKCIDTEIADKVDEYMALPYTIIIEQEDKLYHGKVEQLPSINEYGNTHESTYESVQKAMIYYFKYAIENNIEIPTP